MSTVSPRILLIPEVTVFVHPISCDVHPTYPPGFRWAVHIGGGPPDDLDRCAIAGHQYKVRMARMVGESHGAAACRALRLMGIAATYRVSVLGWDPIPAEADHRQLVVIRGQE